MNNHLKKVLYNFKKYSGDIELSRKDVNKSIVIMRFTILFFFMSIWGALATSYSQTAKLSLDVKNGTISQVIKEIEKQSEFTFVYNVNEVNLNKEVSVNFKNQSITEVLEELFGNNSLGYKITGRHIALFVKDLQQQNSIKIKGTVTDEKGEPVIGANVFIAGTTNGAVSDVDGRFELLVPANSILKVSYIGYIDQKVKIVDGKQSYAIVLKENSETLDEVVVVGYGSQKKSNITGSVASIRTSDYNDLNMDVTNVLQGRVAGVNVTNGGIIIRGAASINGSDPLWIVDGVPGGAPNMNDIESLEILKDAASTAIYGARGAGGVILVTTKKGNPGKITVNAKVNVGVAMPIDIPDMLQTVDYVDRKIAAGFTYNEASGWDNPSALPNTNWKDYVWNNALKQNYFVQVTGGNETTSFNTSAEFVKNERVQKGAYDSAGNLRMSSQTKFGKRFKMTEIITLGFSNNVPALYGIEESSKIYYRQVPTMEPYDISNTAGGGWGKQPAGGYYEGPNPAAIIGSVHAKNKAYKGGANLIFDWEIIDNLRAQVTFSGNFSSYANNNFQEYWSTGNVSEQQKYTKDYGESFNLRMLYTLTYDRTFGGKHYLKGMIGYEAYKAESTSAGGWKTGFSVEPVEDMSLGSGSTEALGGKGLSRSLSQFARLNYAYADKYMVEANIRRDGYDNFGPKNRFGIFPSASLGWNVTKESFISENENLRWLSQLKLRASIGRIGNNTVPQFLYEPSYTSNYLYYSYDSKTTSRGFWYSNIPNAAIKWEDVTQWNVGLDASLFNNRLNTTIEYYNKKTSDMLYSIGAPPSSGAYTSDIFAKAPSYTANIGEISNKGFEWMIQWRDSYQDFKYDMAFTLSTNKNRVIKLSDQINPIIWKGTSTGINSSIYRTENGNPMGQMYGYVVDGIIQDKAEIDALNAKSQGGVYQQAGTAAGDLKYRDMNGDNKITEADKTFIGNPWPKMILGLNLNFSYKGFDLNMGWTANTGVDIFNSAKAYERSFYGDFNTTYKVFEAWSPTNMSSEHPRVINSDPNNNFKNVSSYFVEDGSFLKLKNLHFGYNLPKTFLSKLGIQGLKFYVNCDNMLIISKFQGDPEIGGGYLQRNHYTEKRFPKTRSVMGGLSLTL